MSALTIKQLNALFRDATLAITGLPPENVTFSYQPNSAPFNEQAVNAAYLYVTQINSPADKFTYPLLTTTDSQITGNLAQAYTRVMQCAWSFYGPDSAELADALRAGILTERIREPLRLQKIYPLPRIEAPVRRNELINNQWWERTDIKVQLNVQTDHSALQPYFSGATVSVLESGGDSEVITIQP